MMMGNMGSGGSMGMGMDSMNMGGSMGGSGMGSMNMQMGPMPGMAQGTMPTGPMPGMNHGYTSVDPSAIGGMNHYGTGVATNNVLGGLDLTGLLIWLFNFAINIFAILLVIGLIVGVVVFLKRYLFNNTGISSVFAVQPKPACAKCGQTIQTGWSCCPKCGDSLVANQAINAQPKTV
ncbi:MAG: hypothetical protein ACYDG6_04275 [Thermincolia bacterium]